jgi:hypothetical protein
MTTDFRSVILRREQTGVARIVKSVTTIFAVDLEEMAHEVQAR